MFHFKHQLLGSLLHYDTNNQVCHSMKPNSLSHTNHSLETSLHGIPSTNNNIILIMHISPFTQENCPTITNMNHNLTPLPIWHTFDNQQYYTHDCIGNNAHISAFTQENLPTMTNMNHDFSKTCCPSCLIQTS